MGGEDPVVHQQETPERRQGAKQITGFTGELIRDVCAPEIMKQTGVPGLCLAWRGWPPSITPSW